MQQQSKSKNHKKTNTYSHENMVFASFIQTSLLFLLTFHLQTGPI